MTERSRGRTLVTGGARSGKSAWAEQQLLTAPDVDYLATSEVRVGDAEWESRVALHRDRRPTSWQTVETIDIASELRKDSDASLLVDCLAVWLARILDEVEAWSAPAEQFQPALQDRIDELVLAVRESARDVILVTNEVGLGIVPESPGTRLYRDELGRLNARIAAECDDVWICFVGIARRLK